MRLVDADVLNFCSADFDTYEDYSFTFDMIDNAHTIEVEPVRYGRWVYDNEAGFWKCSLCNRAAISSGYGQELSEHCPRCGARMVGG